MITTCKKCARSFVDGVHSHGPQPMNKEGLEFVLDIKKYKDILECACCGALVPIATVKKQGMNNWYILPMTIAAFCPGCSHLLGFNK